MKRLSLLSQFNTQGDIKSVAVNNSIIFLANDELGLQIVNASIPVNPTLLSTFSLNGASQVKQGNGVIYVKDNEGIKILEASNPFAANLIGSIDSPASWSADLKDFDVGSGYLYVAENYVKIFDVNIPSNPFKAGEYNWLNAFGTIKAIKQRHEICYTLWDNLGLVMLDTSNPAFPTFITKVSVTQPQSALAITNQFALIANNQNVVQFIDTTLPKTRLNNYPASEIRDVVTNDIAGDRITFIATGYNQKMLVLNMTNLDKPTLLNQYTASGNVNQINLRNGLAYLNTGEVINVTNPATLAPIGTALNGNLLFTNNNHTYTYFGNSIEMYKMTGPLSFDYLGMYLQERPIEKLTSKGNQLYVISDKFLATDDKLDVLDSNYIPDTAVSHLFLSGQAKSVNLVDDVAVFSGAGYVPNHGLAMVNISNPQNPTLISSFATAGTGADAKVIDGLAYVANEVGSNTDGNLQIVNITDPANPVAVSQFTTSTYPDRVVIKDNKAYIVNRTVGLQIVDVTDPNNMLELGYYLTPGKTLRDVFIKDNLAYLLDYDGFQIINISNPANPSFVGNYGSFEFANSIQVIGNLAYVAAENFHIVDISNPSIPQKLASYDIDTRFYGFVIKNNYAYLTAQGSGVIIIDISQPTAPIFVTQIHQALSGSRAITQSDDFTFTAADNSGMYAFNHNALLQVRQGYYNGLIAAKDIQLINQTAIVADSSAGIKFFDVSNSSSPTLTHSYQTTPPINPQKILLDGKNLYYSDSDALRVLNINNLSAPQAVSAFELGHQPTAMAIDEDVVIFGSIKNSLYGGSGLYTLNKTRLFTQQDSIAGEFHGITQTVKAMHIMDNLLVVADGATGKVRVLNISEPASAFVIDDYSQSNLVSLTSEHNIIYAAKGQDGLAIFAFDEAPELIKNQIDITQGKSIILTSNNLAATDKNVADNSLRFTVSHIINCKFTRINSSTPITQFTQDDINNQQIRFTHIDNGSMFIKPNFTLSVSNGLISTDNIMASINFKAPPVVKQPIADQKIKLHQPFRLTIDPNTFFDPNFDPLTLTAQEGNQPLPATMQFDQQSNTLSGTLNTTEPHHINLTATDPSNLTASTGFTLTAAAAANNKLLGLGTETVAAIAGGVGAVLATAACCFFAKRGCPNRGRYRQEEHDITQLAAMNDQETPADGTSADFSV